jgi:predicted DNA-binding protein
MPAVVARFSVTMYIHHMTRTQLYLDDAVHSRLARLAKQQGRTLSDLVREALDRVYGAPGVEDQLRSLRAIEGLWRDRDDLPRTDVYVRRLRRSTRRVKPSR